MIFVLQYVVGKHNPDFAGTSQQDSHDFLTFLMDGLHEGLNRVSVRVITHPPSLSIYSYSNCCLIYDSSHILVPTVTLEFRHDRFLSLCVK